MLEFMDFPLWEEKLESIPGIEGEEAGSVYNQWGTGSAYRGPVKYITQKNSQAAPSCLPAHGASGASLQTLLQHSRGPHGWPKSTTPGYQEMGNV